MAMERALEPALVLCGACMGRAELERRWLPLRARDGALLVRDVCVRPRCPHLQVRGHLCVAHALELECAWQGNFRVRACQGCRVSTLQLYGEQREVWLILAASELAAAARGVERRVKTLTSDGASSPEPPAKKPLQSLARRPRLRRKSSRVVNQHVEKEQMIALEWSLGNLPLENSKHLWMDNHKRAEMEKDPAAYYAAMKPPPKEQPDINARPEPHEVFCATLGCGRFAKTGNHCRFHSSTPLVFIKPAGETAATSALSK